MATMNRKQWNEAAKANAERVRSTHETAHRIAQALVETASRPVELTVATAQVGASVGISYCPEHASEREGLLKAADAAMYAAKAGGRGIWRVAAWPGDAPGAARTGRPS